MCGLGNAVLLEGAVDGVAGEEGVGAERLIGLLAEGAGKAGTVDPLSPSDVSNRKAAGAKGCRFYLYTGVVADLDVLDEVTLGDDDTGTLMATDERELGG